MKGFRIALGICFALGIAAGCSDVQRPEQVSPPVPTGLDGLVSSIVIAESNVINDYLVELNSRVFDGSQTTFTYTVSGTGVLESMTHFTVELPPCAPAPASYTPTGSVSINFDPNSGLYGIDWHVTVGPNDSQTYTITFPGDVPLGVVNAAVRTPSTVLVGEIAGPCAGYEISGTVYVDADSSLTQDAGEGGIVAVTIELVDADDNVQTALTDADGHYSFLKVPGTYTVRIPSVTSAADFNEELYESFDPTTATTMSVTVGPDATGVDFGFEPDTRGLINDFDTGALTTTGQPIRFWKKQLQSAISGGGNPDVLPAALLGYLYEIEGLFFPTPFQFSDGSELEEALALLKEKPIKKDEVLELRQELLAAELNYVSGRTMNDVDLQVILLSWAESLVIDNSGSPALVAKGGLGGPSLVATRGVRDGITLLNDMNGGTGGGGGEE